jgi:hypothetical protein
MEQNICKASINRFAGQSRPMLWEDREMGEWQPIETAPRDGTEIIGIFHRQYDEDSPPTTYGPWTVAWDGRKWRSSWDGSEVVEYQDDFGIQYKGPDIAPTHWAPMPLPPSHSETP